MSLLIDVEKVSHVMLADGWHEVSTKTFYLDSYEFGEYPDDGDKHDAMLLHGGGQSGVCATGFSFIEVNTLQKYRGPLTSILAVVEKD